MNLARTLAPLALLLAFTLTGCATVQHGPLQRIHVSSEPAGADIALKDCGVPDRDRVTPATVLVSRRASDCEILISMPDHFTARVPLTREVSSTTHENLIPLTAPCGELGDCGSVGEAFFLTLMGAAVTGVGYTVDFATGGAFELHPSEVHVRLRHRLDPPDDELDADPDDDVDDADEPEDAEPVGPASTSGGRR